MAEKSFLDRNPIENLRALLGAAPGQSAGEKLSRLPPGRDVFKERASAEALFDIFGGFAGMTGGGKIIDFAKSKAKVMANKSLSDIEKFGIARIKQMRPSELSKIGLNDLRSLTPPQLDAMISYLDDVTDQLAKHSMKIRSLPEAERALVARQTADIQVVRSMAQHLKEVRQAVSGISAETAEKINRSTNTAGEVAKGRSAIARTFIEDPNSLTEDIIKGMSKEQLRNIVEQVGTIAKAGTVKPRDRIHALDLLGMVMRINKVMKGKKGK